MHQLRLVCRLFHSSAVCSNIQRYCDKLCVSQTAHIVLLWYTLCHKQHITNWKYAETESSCRSSLITNTVTHQESHRYRIFVALMLFGCHSLTISMLCWSTKHHHHVAEFLTTTTMTRTTQLLVDRVMQHIVTSTSTHQPQLMHTLMLLSILSHTAKEELFFRQANFTHTNLEI